MPHLNAYSVYSHTLHDSCLDLRKVHLSQSIHKDSHRNRPIILTSSALKDINPMFSSESVLFSMEMVLSFAMVRILLLFQMEDFYRKKSVQNLDKVVVTNVR